MTEPKERQYTEKEVKMLLILEHDYGVFMNWFQQGGSSAERSILDSSIKDMKRVLEYMDKYLSTVEKYNPRLRNAVLKVVSTINVEKVYRDAML